MTTLKSWIGKAADRSTNRGQLLCCIVRLLYVATFAPVIVVLGLAIVYMLVTTEMLRMGYIVMTFTINICGRLALWLLETIAYQVGAAPDPLTDQIEQPGLCCGIGKNTPVQL